MEIKNKVFTGQSIALESYSADVANKSILSAFDVKAIYRNMLAMKKYVNNPTLSQSKKTIWDSSEDTIIMQYYKLASRETVNMKKKTQYSIFIDLVDILCNRTESSIPFRYRQLVVANKEVKQKEKGLSVVNTVAQNSENSTQISAQNFVENCGDDLLDIVVDTIENLDTAGVEVTDLFKGILTLSQKAVSNSNVHKINVLEGQINGLEETLGEMREDKKQLEEENNMLRDKNITLQREIDRLLAEFSNLYKEIENFEHLSGKQKLKRLTDHNSRLKYVLGKYNEVIAVG